MKQSLLPVGRERKKARERETEKEKERRERERERESSRLYSVQHAGIPGA